MTEPVSEFVHQLRSLRQAQGLSIRALAALVGVSSVTIWKWEKGDSKPRARLIPPLARALDVSPILLAPEGRTIVAPAASAAKAEIDETTVLGGLPAAQEDSTAPNQPEALADVISRAKQMIAEASGTGTNNVTILIEY